VYVVGLGGRGGRGMTRLVEEDEDRLVEEVLVAEESETRCRLARGAAGGGLLEVEALLTKGTSPSDEEEEYRRDRC
jgi:dihydrodipicolinate reductase